MPGLLLFALLMSAAGAATAQELWQADAARLSLSLYPQRLAALGLNAGPRFRIDADDGHLRAEFHSTEASAWTFSAPGGVYHALHDGRLAFDQPLRLQHDARGNVLSLGVFFLVPDRDKHLALQDAAGVTWLTIDHMHPRLLSSEAVLSYRFADLRIAPALARRLGDPRHAGDVLGAVELQTRVAPPGGQTTARGAIDPGLTQCEGRPPNYRVNFNADPEDDIPVDIALTAINHVGCNFCADQDINLVPSVSLSNLGPADVPWFWRLTGPLERSQDFNDYGGFLPDGGWVTEYAVQHPYLVWALYRSDERGLRMLGRSAVKHAFNAINEDCPCREGKVFWAGCGDTYGFATNADIQMLAPREEIDAASGRWQHLNSNFDPDNDLRFDPDSPPPGRAGRYYEQLTVPAAELSRPGEYRLEAWYIVAGDRDIFNSLGHIRVEPQQIGPLDSPDRPWTFPLAGGLQTGPVIDRWVDSAPGSRQSRLCSRPDPNGAADGIACEGFSAGRGHLQLAVDSEDLGGGRYRYRYALMNFDYDPQLRALSLPLAAGFELDALEFADADFEPANDWQAVRDTAAGTLSWVAPVSSAALDWGTLYRFGFIADAPPVEVDAGLVAPDGVTETLTTLGPGAPPLYQDGFERDVEN